MIFWLLCRNGFSRAQCGFAGLPPVARHLEENGLLGADRQTYDFNARTLQRLHTAHRTRKKCPARERG